MTVLKIDGFDHYTKIENKWELFSQTHGAGNAASYIRVDSTTGKSSTGSFLLDWNRTGGEPVPANPRVYPGITFADKTEIIIGFHVMSSVVDQQNDAGNLIMSFGDVATGNTLLQRTDVSVAFGNGGIDQSTGVFITGSGSSTPNSYAFKDMPFDVWNHVEVRLKIDPVVGEYEVRINGVQELLVVGADTTPDSAVINFMRFEENGKGTIYVDNFYLLDTTGTTNNSLLGESIVSPMYVDDSTRVCNNFAFVGATSAPNAVNELLQDEDSSYVDFDTGGKMTFDMSTVAAAGIVPTTIHAAQVVNMTKRSSAVTAKYKDTIGFKGTVYLNTVETTPSDTIYAASVYVLETDPVDNIAWTASGLDILDCGLEVTFKGT